VTDTLAEVKKGTFTPDDLKQLAFAMGFQVVEGTDTAALVSKTAELEVKLGATSHRASMAEGAFSGKQDLTPESLAAIAGSMGLVVATKADADEISGKIRELSDRAETAEAALAVAKADVDAASKRAETAEALIATATQPGEGQ
jgi:hypothetical protein